MRRVQACALVTGIVDIHVMVALMQGRAVGVVIYTDGDVKPSLKPAGVGAWHGGFPGGITLPFDCATTYSVLDGTHAIHTRWVFPCCG